MMAEDQGAGEAQGTEQEEPDYRALYEAEREHSRKWERQAKANKAAADELARAQEAGKSAEDRIAELKARLDEKERAETRARIAAKVAEEKGVPAELLVGDDEEAMGAYADKMISHFKPKPASRTEQPGSFDAGGKDDTGLRELTRQLFGS